MADVPVYGRMASPDDSINEEAYAKLVARARRAVAWLIHSAPDPDVRAALQAATFFDDVPGDQKEEFERLYVGTALKPNFSGRCIIEIGRAHV